MTDHDPTVTTDVAALTDDVHRSMLELLPPDLFDLSDLDAGVARLTALFASAPPEPVSGVEVDDRNVRTADGHDLLVRLYRPESSSPGPLPALLWMHGGGLVMGGVAMDDAHCAEMALAVGAVVASVDYRLAPAWPYPTPLEDCHTALVWLRDEARSLGVDVSRIAIGGGSAGGGLAAGLALLARDRATVRPCFQLLRYPMLDDRDSTPSMRRTTDGRVWNRVANRAGWGAYLGDLAGSDDVAVYAAAARATDLRDLPPAIVTVGALDAFLDEDVAYARGLIAAGVPTELHVHPGAFHGSDVMVPHADASTRWRRDEHDALRRAFAQADPSPASNIDHQQ